ncbi:5-carboxymethyl-2-hydroxymuconate delta-isomerase [Klebsiella pneumoniae subsp. pneumoniae]|nr:5-carboxymethyl-2-hydroxymuconate delta-isomerase [Klebsiella pneumoniae subsp. pneumoniae]
MPPHFIAGGVATISANRPSLPGLFAEVNEALAATGIFPIGGIREAAPTGWIPGRWPTSRQDYAFVHIDPERSAPGAAWRAVRTWEDMLFALIKIHLATLTESRYLALSFAMEELDPDAELQTKQRARVLFK